ncbi:MAG TPA: hypothetical protein VFE72_08820 [Lysobacter sp.]|nr:hypothetical protein [Lysobacter sp.]
MKIKLSKEALAKALEIENSRLFYSIDGEDVRVTLPNGGVAIVGEEPRPLPPAFWRAASQAGCAVLDAQGNKVRITKADLEGPAAPAGSTDQSRHDLLVQACIDIIEHEKHIDAGGEPKPEFKGALSKGAEPAPIVRWLEKRVGFSVTAEERNRAWSIALSQTDDEDGDEDGDDDEQE